MIQDSLGDEKLRALEEARRALVAKYGEWTAHNIQLSGPVHTIGEQPRPEKLPRIVQVVADLVGKPLNQIRIVDLGCLEGLYAIEFAKHGAEVVGIDGREANLAKAEFSKNALGLDNLTFKRDDIRNLSPEKYGYFDVVLCVGVFYHLDALSGIRLMAQMHKVCRRMMVMDTYIGLSPRDSFQHDGHVYAGITVTEHTPETAANDKQADLWASLDNVTSAWLTRASLLNLFSHVGFTSAFECHNPSEIDKFIDRVTLVAMRGEPQTLRVAANLRDLPVYDWPERITTAANPKQNQHYERSKRLSHLVPKPIRRGLKTLLSATGLRKRNDAPWEWDAPFKKRKGDD